MADRILLSNEQLGSARPGGYAFDEKVYTFSLANESSALTGSATLVPLFMASEHGRIVDFYIGVAVPSLSASGFVSGNVSADVRINSVAICSTQPQIPGGVGSAAQTSARITTNNTYTSAAGKPSPVSAVLNQNSTAFSAGDMISIDYNLVSGGSAAAGAAGKGFYAAVVVRQAAR